MALWAIRALYKDNQKHVEREIEMAEAAFPLAEQVKALLSDVRNLLDQRLPPKR